MPRPAGVKAPESDRPTVGLLVEVFRGEQPARFAQTAGVVGKKRVFHELRHGGLSRQAGRVDALVADLVQVLLLRCEFLHPEILSFFPLSFSVREISRER